MTGSGAGFCGGYRTAGYMNSGGGRGACGRGGFGGGYGRRNRYFETGLPGWVRSGRFGEPLMEGNPLLEKQFLKARMESLQTELDLVKRRLEESEKKGAAE
jgi:hypothetical protein